MRAKDNSNNNNKKQKYSDVFTKIINKNITIVLSVVLTVALIVMGYLCVLYTNSKIRREAENYNAQVEKWVLEQSRILDMFVNGVEAQGDLYKDYDRAVEYLNDITLKYDHISCTYISDPALPDLVIMNNGWKPDPDFDVAGRSWYSGAMNSDDIYITEPYADEQTGGYCITFSKKVVIDGQVIGVFGIDFYMDKLTSILSESYTGSNYAFLVGPDGTIITHPSEDYQLGGDVKVNIADTKYNRCMGKNGSVETMVNYSKKLKTITSASSEDSPFTVIVVKDWLQVYMDFVKTFVLYLILFFVSTYVSRLFNKKTIGKWFRPLEGLAEKIPAIAEGNLDVTFDEEEVSLEITILQESLNTTISTLKSYIDDIARILEEIASGNLACEAGVTYRGDFARLENSISQITSNLHSLIQDIDFSAKKFRHISEQVSDVSGQVAEGSSTQADNINNLATNMGILRENMNSATRNAQNVINIVVANNANLRDISTIQMEELNQKMRDIEESSARIGECLEMINKINSQTNLLALNASIEAARAGDAGKGFVVVADEIRGLSNDTAKTSEIINDMVNKNNAAVQDGMNIMNDTIHVLENNLNSFEVAKNEISNMAEVFKQQEEYIESISESVSEIENIVRSNSEISKINSETAEQMTEQTELLNQQIHNFNL